MSLAAIVAALAITNDAADARHHVHFAHHARRFHRHASAGGYSPPGASIVVDGNNGDVLEASNPDALRHPASLTKVMTLYLLFEQLDAGKLRLDSPLRVSEHASEQAPTKLGLKPGQTIAVEDAIRGIVTRSANDAAVVIAENLGGDEQRFARLMTQKAHALGMTRTTYVNASGLPDDDQITTARDQALLGRAIQERFPRYYHYFSTPSFVFRGQVIRNHDHLLSEMDGVDGIKTGFTTASGFNLLTSIHHDGRFLVAVVMGGSSAASRDAHMRDLIATHIKLAALRRSPAAVAERIEPRREPQQVAFVKETTAARAEPAASAHRKSPVGSTDPIKPFLVRTITYRTAPAQTSSLSQMPALVPLSRPVAARQPIYAAPSEAAAEAAPSVVASADPAELPAAAPAMPQRPERDYADAATGNAAIADAPPARGRLHGGWIIQIGAFDGEAEAREHLNAAQTKLHDALAAADPFTERVKKGDKALYRARFAGFDKATAEAVCRELKRSDFECMALKD